MRSDLNPFRPRALLEAHACTIDTAVLFHDSWFPPDLPRITPSSDGGQILGCLRVDHTQVVQRTLFLFKNDKFMDMLTGRSHSIFPPLLSALLRGGERSWNPTVNKASKEARNVGPRCSRASIT